MRRCPPPLLAILAALAGAPAAALGADNHGGLVQAGDAVPGHPSMTYLDLLRLAVPDLALNPADHQIEAHLDPPRHIAGHDMEGPPPDPAVLGFLSERRFLTAGHKRLALLADLGADPDRAADTALMVLFDDEPPTPKVLDVADVALDRDTDFAADQSVLPLGPQDSALVVYSEHGEADITLGHYLVISPVDDTLKLVGRFDITSERLCSWSGVETAQFATASDPGQPYWRIEAKVRAVFAPTGQQGCTDEHTMKAQDRRFQASWRWNTAAWAFEPGPTTLGELAALNGQAF